MRVTTNTILATLSYFFALLAASLAAHAFEPTRLVTQNTLVTITPPLAKFQAALGNETTLTELLEKMRPGGTIPTDFADKVDHVAAGGGQTMGTASRGLNGLGGIFGHVLVKAAKLKQSDTDKSYDPDKAVTLWSRGQIYGYFFDHDTKQGYLHVQTEVTIGKPDGSMDVDRFRYEVDIGAPGFTALPKIDTDPDDVFPGGDIPISATKAAEGGWNWKLWAKGPSIRVVRLWVDHNDNGIFEPTERIKDTGPLTGGWQDEWRNVLQGADPDACIDMMFQSYPPETLPVGVTPPFYCLGRCQNPPIINTM